MAGIGSVNGERALGGDGGRHVVQMWVNVCSSRVLGDDESLMMTADLERAERDQ